MKKFTNNKKLLKKVPYTADTYGDEESDDAENIDDMEMVEEGIGE